MRKADVEVLFVFNGVRKKPIYSGYRPIHLITNDYLTSGIHLYYNRDVVMPCDTVEGTIEFITPEEYPNCLWIGKEIPIQEGSYVVGYAIVKKILNPLLALNDFR